MKLLSRSLLVPALLLITGSLLAQVSDANNIPNWPAPATWSPHAGGGGITTMTDISPAIPFVPITPCRIADTRGNGFSGTQGPPALTTSARTIDVGGTVVGVPAQCGIPAFAAAVSFQFTIVSPNSNGNLVAWPAGDVEPTISILNWSAGESALGNGTIVPLGDIGGINVKINAAIGGATGHLVVDVNGYFAPIGNGGTAFNYATSHPVRAAFIANTDPVSGFGLVVESHSISEDDAAIHGHMLGTSGVTFGILGQNPSGTAGAAGILGQSQAQMGATYGVFGTSSSGSSNAAGVLGQADFDSNPVVTPVSLIAGVRGESGVFGVLGFGEDSGVHGVLVNSAGTIQARGWLGTSSGVDTDPPGGGPPWGVFANAHIGATGVKAFLDPHPTDPSKVIAYVSLEGPEAGTYFRGRGRFVRGIARITVPEHFRMVTDPDGLTVQITPIGGMATVGVLRVDLNEIVAQSSRNLEFFYVVQGVRATYRDVSPIRRGREFAPESADATMPAWLSPAQKRLLIQNGTYREDGTVNSETAKRLGWDLVWAERERPRPRPE